MGFTLSLRVVILAVISKDVWQIWTDEKNIAWLEAADKISDDHFSFAAEDQRKLHFGMLMQIIIKMTLMVFLQAERFLRCFRNFEW